MRQAQETEFDPVGENRLGAMAAEDYGESPATVAGNDGQLVGPHALMLAVLEDAIHCAGLLSHPRRPEQGRLRQRARTWLRSVDRDWLFSFECVCEALSIDARRLRRRVLREDLTPLPGRRRRIHGMPRPPTKLDRP